MRAGLVDISDDKRQKLYEKAISSYEEVGEATSGPASAEAWLKSADIHLLMGNNAKAEAACVNALAMSDSGIIGYAIQIRLASIKVAAGDMNGASQILKTLSTTETGTLAENALLMLAEAYVDQGSVEMAQQVATEFSSRFPESTRGDRLTKLQLEL